MFIIYYAASYPTEYWPAIVHRSLTSSLLISSQDCFDGELPQEFSPRYSIEFNKYDQNNYTNVVPIALCQTEGKSGCDPSLAYVVRHPQYSSTTNVNDVALIFLPEGRVTEITSVPRVGLNRNPDVPAVGQNLEVFGWGLISFEPNLMSPDIIQTLTVQASATQDCWAFDGGSIVTADVLCATIEGKGIGQGDSGTCNSWLRYF